MPFKLKIEQSMSLQHFYYYYLLFLCTAIDYHSKRFFLHYLCIIWYTFYFFYLVPGVEILDIIFCVQETQVEQFIYKWLCTKTKFPIFLKKTNKQKNKNKLKQTLIAKTGILWWIHVVIRNSEYLSLEVLLLTLMCSCVFSSGKSEHS